MPHAGPPPSAKPGGRIEDSPEQWQELGTAPQLAGPLPLAPFGVPSHITPAKITSRDPVIWLHNTREDVEFLSQALGGGGLTLSIVTQGKKADRCWPRSLSCPWEARQHCVGVIPFTLTLFFHPSQNAHFEAVQAPGRELCTLDSC